MARPCCHSQTDGIHAAFAPVNVFVSLDFELTQAKAINGLINLSSIRNMVLGNIS